MRLSCLPVSFFTDIVSGRMSVGAWARMGAELGLDAIDLSILFVPDRTPAAVAALRREIEAQGIRVAMITSYPDFTHPDARQRELELAFEREVMTVAAGLGADLVRVTAGQAHPETGIADGIAWAADGLRRLVESTRGLERDPGLRKSRQAGRLALHRFLPAAGNLHRDRAPNSGCGPGGQLRRRQRGDLCR